MLYIDRRKVPCHVDMLRCVFRAGIGSSEFVREWHVAPSNGLTGPRIYVMQEFLTDGEVLPTAQSRCHAMSPALKDGPLEYIALRIAIINSMVQLRSSRT